MKLSPTPEKIEIVPENYFAPLDLARVFASQAPLEVDLGCGDGTFLAALAAQNRHKNFLGIERLLTRVRSASRKIAQHGLTNARVLRIETSYAVHHLLPAQSVSAFYLLFPDPWPKRRHQHRRTVTPEFLELIQQALVPDGLLRIATDQFDYFRQMQRIALQSGFKLSIEKMSICHRQNLKNDFRNAAWPFIGFCYEKFPKLNKTLLPNGHERISTPPLRFDPGEIV